MVGLIVYAACDERDHVRLRVIVKARAKRQTDGTGKSNNGMLIGSIFEQMSVSVLI